MASIAETILSVTRTDEGKDPEGLQSISYQAIGESTVGSGFICGISTTNTPAADRTMISGIEHHKGGAQT